MGDLFRRPLIVVDTETTGLLSDPDASPWEVAAVLLDVQGNEIDQIEIVGRPPIWREDMRRIVALGGMDPDDLLSRSLIRDGALDVSDWIGANIAKGANVTAFNVAFDRPMLIRAMIAPPKEYWAPCIMERVKPIMGEAGALPWFDKYNDWKMPKLSEAAAFFNVPQQEPAHRALADARTAALIAVELVKRMKGAK